MAQAGISAKAAAAELWAPIAPREAGFATDMEARLDKAIADKQVWNLHGLIVLRNDRVVLERYFASDDHKRGSATSVMSCSSRIRRMICALAPRASSVCSTA